jgi:nitrogenase molybdenum-iron protein beta chain
MPIVHCGPGCIDQQFMSQSFFNGYQGGGKGGGSVIPSSNISSTEVIFGGEQRLRELIAASLKVLDARLFVVMTGCAPELVGDDIAPVIEEFRAQGINIVYALTGGFKGNNFTGYETAIRAIIDQFTGEYSGPRDPERVNLWSLPPVHNPFWSGDLTEIKRMLEGIGLKVNTMFGHHSLGVSEWKDIPQAGFNLLLSPWLGLSTVRHLRDKYGQPYLHIPALPIGAGASAEFLRQTASFAALDQNLTEAFIKSEEDNYYLYLERFSDFYSEYWWGLHEGFVLSADSAYALSIAKFLVRQLGMEPYKIILTENPPEEHREFIRAQFHNLDHDTAAEVEFEEDSYRIHASIRQAEFGAKPPLIFGTTWERDLAKELNASIIEITFPASYEVVLSKSYIGYRGALTFLEKINYTIVGAFSA